MSYTIIDSDGDCVAREFDDLNTAIADAKRFIVSEITPHHDAYQYTIHEMHHDGSPLEKVASVKLEIDWTVWKL